MDEGKWITINGRHIFLKEGQSPMDAFIRSKGKESKEYKDDFPYKIDNTLEGDDLYNEMSDESYYSEKISKEDIETIKEWYVGQSYSTDLNEHLREDKDFAIDKPIIKALDKACETYEVKEKMAGTRFVDMTYLRNAYSLEIPYGQIDRSKIADSMKEFIGSELSSKAYTSFSLNESGNGMFNNLAVKMKLNLPKGTKMFVADNLGEYEAILGRNKKMILKDVGFQESKIKGLEKEYGKILLTYEVIEDEKK